MKSIRFFLITVLFSVIAIVMFVAMLVGYQRSLQQADILLDSELQEKYQIISDLIHSSKDTSLFKSMPSKITPADKVNSAIYQIIDENNQVIFQSSDFSKSPITIISPDTKYFNFNGYRWRALIKKDFYLPLWIVVAERDDLRFRMADTIIVNILKPILIGLFCIVLLVWLVVRSGFKPIESLANSIRERSASDLSEVSMDDIPNELRSISESVNELFKRLTNSFDREKRFTSDAAHEMRNPITALKIHIDNLLEEFPERNDSLLKAKKAIDRLMNLVDQMLILHRVSPDKYLASFSCINLKAVVQDVIAEIYADIEKKSQTIELEGPECHINADLFGIEVLVKNLITNASKYTPDHGRIRVRLHDNSNAHSGVSFLVDDSGVGIPASERQRVFDRFYRIGGDRHDSKTIGSGLGLSIVKHIIELHQASLELKKSELGGLCVEINFPVQRNCN